MPFTPKSMFKDSATDAIAIVLFGDSGAGKTTMLDSLPEGETLIGSIEGGLSVLKKDHAYEEFLMPSLKNPRTFTEKFNDMYNHLRFEDHPYKFVAIDSTSEMERYLQYSMCYAASKQVPTLNHYGSAAAIMRKTIMEFRDLKKAGNNKVGRGIHVIFLAGSFPLETLKTEDTTLTRRFPLLTKKFSQEICGLVDIVAHLETDTNGTRLLRMHPTSEVMAKTRFDHRNIVQKNAAMPIDLLAEVIQPAIDHQQKKGASQAKTATGTGGSTAGSTKPAGSANANSAASRPSGGMLPHKK